MRVLIQTLFIVVAILSVMLTRAVVLEDVTNIIFLLGMALGTVLTATIYILFYLWPLSKAFTSQPETPQQHNFILSGEQSEQSLKSEKAMRVLSKFTPAVQRDFIGYTLRVLATTGPSAQFSMYEILTSYAKYHGPAALQKGILRPYPDPTTAEA